MARKRNFYRGENENFEITDFSDSSDDQRPAARKKLRPTTEVIEEFEQVEESGPEVEEKNKFVAEKKVMDKFAPEEKVQGEYVSEGKFKDKIVPEKKVKDKFVPDTKGKITDRSLQATEESADSSSSTEYSQCEAFSFFFNKTPKIIFKKKMPT